MKKLLGNDTVNMVQSIKKYYNLENEHRTNPMLDERFNKKKPKHVVLMVLDGLGHCFLNKTPFLQSKCVEKIDTVFPPTTACATITLQTGLYPCEHAWLGWAQYFKEHDATIELFSGINYSTGESHNLDELLHEIEFDRFYSNLKNSKAFFPIFDPNGYETFDLMLEATKKHIKSNEESFSYVYWNEPDSILHVDGGEGELSKRMLTYLDNAVKEFSNDLEDTMVLITADHGHIDVKGISLDDYPKITECFERMPSIEPRCVNMFIKDGYHEQFNEECNQLKQWFDFYTKEEFINTPFFNFNEKHHYKVDDFLGDYIMIAKDVYFFYGHKPVAEGENPIVFKSAHAGSTALEMEVPLIIID